MRRTIFSLALIVVLAGTGCFGTLGHKAKKAAASLPNLIAAARDAYAKGVMFYELEYEATRANCESGLYSASFCTDLNAIHKSIRETQEAALSRWATRKQILKAEKALFDAVVAQSKIINKVSAPDSSP